MAYCSFRMSFRPLKLHSTSMLLVKVSGLPQFLQLLLIMAVHLLGVVALQWTLANPNSLGPEPIQISEIFGTAAKCVIVTAPYLHSVLGSLGSLPLLHVHRTQNTAPKRSFSTLLIHRMRKT